MGFDGGKYVAAAEVELLENAQVVAIVILATIHFTTIHFITTHFITINFPIWLVWDVPSL